MVLLLYQIIQQVWQIQIWLYIVNIIMNIRIFCVCVCACTSIMSLENLLGTESYKKHICSSIIKYTDSHLERLFRMNNHVLVHYFRWNIHVYRDYYFTPEFAKSLFGIHM